MLLQKPIPRKIVRTDGNVAFLLVLWYMHTMIMNTIYCSYLSSNLALTNPWNSVQSVNEIIEEKMSLFMPSTTTQALHLMDDPIYIKMKEIGIHNATASISLPQISDGKWMAFANTKALLFYYKQNMTITNYTIQ